jgi:hypothetical protein
MKKDSSILPNLFPGSVGLSNPPSNNKQQIPASPELKRKFSGDNIIKKSTRPQRTIIDNTILPVSNESNTTKQQIFSTTAQIVRLNRLCFLLLVPLHQFIFLDKNKF